MYPLFRLFFEKVAINCDGAATPWRASRATLTQLRRPESSVIPHSVDKQYRNPWNEVCGDARVRIVVINRLFCVSQMAKSPVSC